MRRTCVAVLLLLSSAMLHGEGAARSQAPAMGAPAGTTAGRGVWNPQPGAGAVYQVAPKSGSRQQVEYAIVGEEDVHGEKGHWLEAAITEKGRGTTIVKSLIVRAGNEIVTQRLIVQARNENPVELHVSRGPGSTAYQPADMRAQAERVGRETIQVPGGSFESTRYRMKDGTGDYWLSDDVPPYNLVKAVTRDATITLLRRTKDAKSRITGTPEKLSP